MNGFTAKLGILIGVLMLAGCETTIPVQELPKLTFGHLQPIALNIGDIQFVDETGAIPSGQREASHKFPVPPRNAIFSWAQARLQVAGRSDTARFVVHQARVIETPLKIDRGVGGLFKKEVSERYEAEIEASLEIYDSRSIRRAFATARATETATIREDASPNDRQRIWFAMVERLMASFDKAMDASIREHMVGYIQ